VPPPFVRVEDMKRRYEREAVITASPVARLIDELIISLHMADAAFERGDLEAVDDALCRAQDILLALRTDLWGVAADLTHMYRELRDANLQKNWSQAARVLKVVEELAEAWRRAAEQEARRLAAAAGTAVVGE
jgi:flagellar biosynthetic protein FliS